MVVMERILESLLVLDRVLDLEQRLVKLRLDVLLLMHRGEGSSCRGSGSSEWILLDKVLNGLFY